MGRDGSECDDTQMNRSPFGGKLGPSATQFRPLPHLCVRCGKPRAMLPYGDRGLWIHALCKEPDPAKEALLLDPSSGIAKTIPYRQTPR